MTLILTEVNQNVGYIILNRVDKKNALNEQMVQELKNALEDLKQNDSVRVVVLKSNSDVFSAGADLSYLQKLQGNSFEENLEDSMNLKDLFETLYLYPKVTIAQVEGHAIAGGCGLATVTDFCFSVAEAKFGYTEVRIGFIPALVSVFLVRKIGEGRTKELLLSGRLIDASEAEKLGLISRVSTSETIDDDTFKFAQNIAIGTSPQSIEETKKLIDKIDEMGFSEGMDYAARMNAEMRGSSDCKKGISAFLSKEKISWI